MIKYRDRNKYSLNSESYGLTKREWGVIKEDVIRNQLTNIQVSEKYEFEDKEDITLSSKRVWFLYDKLLQEKYNHLYKRDKLVDPILNDFVYCDYDKYGRGKIVSLLSGDLMLVEFLKRDLKIMCSSKDMVTVHDEIKRKITRL